MCTIFVIYKKENNMKFKRLCSWLQFDLFDMHWINGNRKTKKWIKKQMSKRTRRELNKRNKDNENG